MSLSANEQPPLPLTDPGTCADRLIEALGGRIVMALPLGLGKPVHLVNALYRKAKACADIELTIYTALTLEVPKPGSVLEAAFLDPLVERLYKGVPDLDYAADERASRVPDNVHIHEFYFRPGGFLGVRLPQQNYISINYTHAARDLAARGVNVIAQMVAPGDSGGSLSLSCNPDVTLDLIDALKAQGRPPALLVGEINSQLPFMPGDSVVPVADFAMLLEPLEGGYPLFPTPNRSVSLTEHAIALRVATLIEDGGTLQIGIGSLGDAIAWAIGLRGADNKLFRRLVSALGITDPGGSELAESGLDALPQGLYGASEMFVEGFLHLRDCGVLHRCVDDGTFLHAGFYLGSARFYQRLRTLSEQGCEGIEMTRISFTNSLLGDEAHKRAQRKDARFINSAMMVTLGGSVVSDGLDNGQVVSGVGGQYNFVAMAHELAGARSIIVLPATRNSAGKTSSNIVWHYAHTTIPRHLRDLVVTEYGVADLRGASDQEVIVALLNIADSRFQDDLRAQAVAAGKLAVGYEIPAQYTGNYPELLAQRLLDADLQRELPFYPLSTDLTETEAALAVALERVSDFRKITLRNLLPVLLPLRLPLLMQMLQVTWRGFRALRGPVAQDSQLNQALERMMLNEPRGLKARLYQFLLAGALMETVFESNRPLFIRSVRGIGSVRSVRS